nr:MULTISPECIES: Ger(x)C family spore germination C-terminal domain-containing protein [unclassified Bacillus (in: firmicutes)]
MTQRLSSKDSSNLSDYVTFEVSKGRVKRKLKVTTDKNDNVHVNIKLHLQIIVLEYPKGQLHKTKERENLNKQLSKQLTNESKKIIKTLQKAHCDAFGIGRQLIAYHPDLWKKKNWKEDYPKVKFTPEVEVKMLYSGVLN